MPSVRCTIVIILALYSITKPAKNHLINQITLSVNIYNRTWDRHLRSERRQSVL